MPLGAILGGMNQANNALFNAPAAEASNRQSRKFTREMYDQTKVDNLEFWNLQNSYNSPQEQMKRFQAAGLNPNLIYGQGNSGNAGSIPTPDVQPVNFRTPQLPQQDSLAYLQSFADLDIKGAQADNLKAQNAVIQEDVLLKRAQRANIDVGRSRSQFDLDLESELRPFSADYRKGMVRKQNLDIDVTGNRDAREAAMNASNLKEAAERMLNLRVSRGKDQAETDRIRTHIENLEKEGVLKDLDIALQRMGLNQGSPTYARMLGRIVDILANGNLDGALKTAVQHPGQSFQKGSQLIFDSLFK